MFADKGIISLKHDVINEVAKLAFEGKLEEKKRTAIELLNINMDISLIEQITGLSKTEILKLKDLS